MIEWPTPLCSVAGATTTTSPKHAHFPFQSRQAGGVNSIVVRHKYQHRFIISPPAGHGNGAACAMLATFSRRVDAAMVPGEDAGAKRRCIAYSTCSGRATNPSKLPFSPSGRAAPDAL